MVLYNDQYVTPMKHSSDPNAKRTGTADWMQQFHIKLGEVCDNVMKSTMPTDYLDFCDDRKQAFNVPFFGA